MFRQTVKNKKKHQGKRMDSGGGEVKTAGLGARVFFSYKKFM